MEAPPGLDTEVGDEPVASAPIHVEGVCLASRPVEREHQTGSERFVQRMLCGELVELPDELAVPAERQLRVDALLEGSQQHLVQSRDRELCERLVLEARERRPAPHSQGVTLELERRLGLVARQGPACLGGQALEPLQVELLGREAEHVAGGLGVEPRLLAERLAELRDLAVDLGRRRDGGTAGVELIGEPVDRDDAVCVEQQDRERRTLLRPAERDRPAAPGDLQRAKDPELEHRATVAGR